MPSGVCLRRGTRQSLLSRSFEKIARVLPGFKPQWDARKGAEQLYQAYKKSGITLEEFEGPRYQRIAHIQKLLADGILDNDLRHVPLRAPAVAAEQAMNVISTAALPISPGTSLADELKDDAIGEEIDALAAAIFPERRSITGNGVRETLGELGRHVEIARSRSVPIGTPGLRPGRSRVELETSSRCLYQGPVRSTGIKMRLLGPLEEVYINRLFAR